MGDPKKYQVIYADPPWFYKNKTMKGSAENHYPTMSDEELSKFPINDFADQKRCYLLMWTTGPRQPAAIELIKKWGFTYKTIFFSWFKTNKKDKIIPGNSYYTRASTELCLLATRGI